MIQKPPIRQGLRIPEPAKGKIFPWLAAGGPLRAMVAIVNAISNGRILVPITMPDGSVKTARGQLLISDVNAEFQVPVDLSNLNSGINTSGGGGLTQFSLVSDMGLYWMAQLVTNGIAGGQPVNVLKPYKLRITLAAEMILGVAHSYAYSIIGNESSNPNAPFNVYQRVDSFSGTTANQQLIPDAIPGDEIWASSCNITVNYQGNPINFLWLDANVDGRNWTELPAV